MRRASPGHLRRFHLHLASRRTMILIVTSPTPRRAGVIGEIRRYLPGPADYSRKHLRPDLLAGVTVAFVALPLALGFGVTSGAGATAGLVTAIVAGFVAAM